MPTDLNSCLNPRILVVDDSPTQLRQIQFLLEKEGYVVQTAMDGVERCFHRGARTACGCD